MDENIKQLLDFSRELELNNERPWYHEHGAESKRARQTFEELVWYLIFKLVEQDEEIPLMAAKDVIFRLARDVRYGKKGAPPYNPAFRAHIGPRGKLPVPTGYHIRIMSGDRTSLSAGYFPTGIREATKAIRDYICLHGEEWMELISAPEIETLFELKGEKLVNVPRGYDVFSPYAEQLKHKNWYVSCSVPDEDVLSEDFADYVLDVFAKMRPIKDYLNRALNGLILPWES